MENFKIGDRVQFANTLENIEWYELAPEYYPAPYTFGTVIFVGFDGDTKEPDIIRVCWEDEKTKDVHCWFVAPRQIILVKEEETKMKLSEVPGALSLEQLKSMDGRRVLVPETEEVWGGFGEVSVAKDSVISLDEVDGESKGQWDFGYYGRTWIAVPDPYGIVEIG